MYTLSRRSNNHGVMTDKSTHVISSGLGRLFLLLIAFSVFLTFAQPSVAQLTLPTAGYTQDFNSLRSGLPTGWTTRTNARTTSLGSSLAFTNVDPSLAVNSWSNTSGAFKNLSSSVGLTSNANAATQATNTNRCLGIRPTGSFGDPGASFSLQIADTVGKSNFAMTFSMQMLSVQTRTNIWSVQYAVGPSPTNFITLTNYTDPVTFGASTISVSPEVLSPIGNQSQNVWIRVATLTGSTGSGSRDTVGIDDFQLTYEVSADTPVVNSIAPSAAKVGDVVILSGSNLEGVTALSFNGVSQPVFSASANQISAVVPSGATTGPISYSVGASIYAGPTVSILTPVIASLLPDVGVAGNAVSIAGTNFTPLTSVTFSGSGSSIPVTPSSASDTSISVTVPPGAGSGPVTVTTPSGSGSANFRVIAPIAVPYGPESFTNGFGQWFTVNAAGTANWSVVTNSFGGGSTTNGTTNSWAQINGFGSDVPANDWLVLGPVNFSTSSNPVATFETLTRFAISSGITNFGELSLKLSTNYTGIGSPATNGTWVTVPFTKPSADLVVTPSGFVFIPEAAGRSNAWFAFHYQAAGTVNGTTALWQVDNIVFSNSTLVPLGLTLPGIINEGASNVAASVFAAGTNLASPLVVSLSNSSPADVQFKADTNSPATATLQVTIPAGTNAATFYLDAAKDFTPDTNKTVTVTATTTNPAFQSGSGTIVVNNVDYPSTDLTASGYSQGFAGFTNQAALPAGWTLVAANQTYTAWGTADTGAKFSAGTTNVFGYQHTGSTGTAQQILTLRNVTGSAINALTISYNGRAARASETRVPVYTVYVDGQLVPSLSYSTAYGDNFLTRASLQGLDIPNNSTFAIVWSSDRGQSTGSSQQIGLGDVSVQLGYTPFPPSLAGVIVYPEYVYDTTAEVASTVTGDGGSAVTGSGFVYSLASVNDAPTIGGTGVTQVPWSFPGLGGFGSQLSLLTPLSSYAVRAYAANANGTNYSAAASFTTTAPNPEFAGLYTQNFNGFTNANAFPAGWKCFSSSNVNSYGGEWTSGSSSGGFYGTTNQPGVLGYQFTASTGVLQNRMTLKNLTGSNLTNLYISYFGMVTQTQQVRFPSWTVTGDDGSGAVEIAGLSYSTADGTNATRFAQWTNFNVAPGDSFTVTWSADRGENTNTGSSRRIGVGFVQVSTSLQGIVTNAPAVTSTEGLATSVGETVSYQITASGGATGFWATNLPGGLSINGTSGQITGAVTNTNRNGSLLGLVAYNAYGAGEATIPVSIAKGTPVLLVLPSASAITNGQALSNSILTGGSASVVGTFDWYFPTTIPTSTSSQQVIFTPADSANYNTATGSVSVTVLATGENFTTWAQGAPTNSTTVGLYAIGGATSPTATDGVPSQTALTSSNLSIIAIVRTNDPNLTVFGQATANLKDVPWTTNGVTKTNAPDQLSVPSGTARQIFSIERGTNTSLFLRIDSILQP
jgi:hypothetical protein